MKTTNDYCAGQILTINDLRKDMGLPPLSLSRYPEADIPCFHPTADRDLFLLPGWIAVFEKRIPLVRNV